MSGVSSPPTPERFAPSITGLLAQTIDPGSANGSLQPTTNDAQAILCPIPKPVTIAGIAWVSVVTAGITLTAAQNLISLNDVNGNLLGVSADQSAAWLGAGNLPATIAGGPFNLVPPYVWLQLLAVGTTTPVFRSGAPGVSGALGPSAVIRSQRSASGAISLTSFNPATSVTFRNVILIGLS